MNKFNIIRYRGEPKKTITLKGQTVHREEKLFVPEWGQFVPCAPYNDHFIYLNPDTSPGSSAYMCTCGSAAVVANPEKGTGHMFVCLFHAIYGAHTTSYVNRGDWPDIAGDTIEVEGDKRWL